MKTMKKSMKELERMILEDLEGEPSKLNENMIDVAIRLLKEQPKFETGINCDPLSEEMKEFLNHP